MNAPSATGVGKGRRGPLQPLLCTLVGAVIGLGLIIPGALAQDRVGFGPDDSLEEIRAKIALNGYSFAVDRNWVYDLPPAERAKMFRRPPQAGPGPEGLAPTTDLVLQPTERSRAVRFDWRNVEGRCYIGPVRDQGPSSDCWAFGTCAAAESTYNVKTNRYDENCVDMSEMYLIWALGTVPPYQAHFQSDHCDNEGYELYALTRPGAPEGAVGFEGACREADFPFHYGTDPTAAEIERAKTFPRVALKRWGRVFPADYGDTTAQIKAAIATYGCVVTDVRHDAAFVAYKSGIYENTDTQPNIFPYYYASTTHVVSLVGWDDEPPEGGGGCWILRNEWGPHWGENGYMRIRYGSARVNMKAKYFEAGPPAGPYTITGKAAGVVGATIALTGDATALTLTDQCDQFGLTGLADGNYTVTPQHPGYRFTPASRVVTLHGSSATDCDFVASPDGAVLTLEVPQTNAGTTYPPLGERVVSPGEWVYISARPANARYAFARWRLSGRAELQEPDTSPVNRVRLAGNATVSAVFSILPPPDQVNLTMIRNADTGVVTPAPGAHVVPFGQPVPIGTVPGEGNFFFGWAVHGEATIADPGSAQTTVTLVGDAEVEANYAKKAVQLTLTVNPKARGATVPALGVYTVANHRRLEVEASPAAGYCFEKWTSSGNLKIDDLFAARTAVVPTGDATLTAHFRSVVKTATLTMKIVPSAAGATTPENGVHVEPLYAAVEIEARPAPGFIFVSWVSLGGGRLKDCFSNPTTVFLAADAVVTANFEPVADTATLTLGVDPLESGSSTNPGTGEYVVAVGDWVNIAAEPAEGYFFAGWNVSGPAQIRDPLAARTAVALAGNASVTANFDWIVATVTLEMAATPDEAGWLSPTPGAWTLPIGERLAIEAVPADGYVFTEWIAAGGAAIQDPYSARTTVILSGDAQVRAVFGFASPFLGPPKHPPLLVE